MATRLVPAQWRLSAARCFIDSVGQPNTAWYVWFGDHVSSGAADEVYDMVLDTTVEAYRGMIMGKRVSTSDVELVARRIAWTSGTVYAMYDHGDPIMFTKDFYVVVDEGSFSHVYKCLDNNNGAKSTVSPNFADVNALDEIYQTSDGYRWKYMYSVDQTTVDNFATSSYFPVVSNAEVVAAAVPGAIDVVRVYDGGEGYDNYLTGTFDSSHLRVGGNTLVYSVSSNASASPINGFYTGCVLYVSSGDGVGGYSPIVDYFSNASGKYVVLEETLDVNPTNGSEWEVYPAVVVTGGGEQSSNAAARALVNAVGNAVYRVEMLARGADYTYATAAVVANAAVSITRAANVVPVYSPPGGHGADPASELGTTRACLSVRLANTESNTIPATNSFREVGVLKDPAFANVQLGTTNSVGSFYPREQAVRYTGVFLVNTANVAGDSIDCNTGSWTTRLSPGDQLVVSNTDSHQLVTVVSVANDTHVHVNAAISFSCTSATVVLANVDVVTANVIQQTSSNTLLVDTACGWDTSNAYTVIGTKSGATAQIQHVTRNGVEKTFDTFVQCWKYRGSYVSGTFAEDEVVYQGNTYADASATAYLHSAVSEDGLITVLTTNQVGSFDPGVLKGANSGAVFTVTAKYSPEIKYGSGRVTYVENISPVTRAPDQTESFKLILEF